MKKKNFESQLNLRAVMNELNVSATELGRRLEPIRQALGLPIHVNSVCSKK